MSLSFSLIPFSPLWKSPSHHFFHNENRTVYLCWIQFNAVTLQWLRDTPVLKAFLTLHLLDPLRSPVTWHVYPIDSLQCLRSCFRVQCSRPLHSQKKPRSWALIFNGNMPVQSPLCVIVRPVLSQGKKERKKK